MLTEVIGWLATIMILLSFLVKSDMFLLRVLNSTGACLWLVYGILKNDLPVIVLNFIVILIHSYWFIKNRKNENKSSTS